MGRYISSNSGDGAVAGTIPISSGGTGQVTAPLALTALGGLSLSDLRNFSYSAGLNFTRLDLGIKNSGTVIINRAEAAVIKVTVGGPITLSLSGFINNKFGDILLELVNGGSSIVTMPNVNWILPTTGGITNSFATYLTATGKLPAALQSSGSDFILFWSDDGGATVYGKVI